MIFFRKILILILFVTTAVAQVSVIEDSLYSPSVNSKMKFCILPPVGYVNRTEYYPSVYLLHGYNGKYTDCVKQTELTRYVSKHQFIIITPDPKNSWYSNSITKPNANYEDYIIRDLIPYVDKKYSTIHKKNRRAIVGLSMGGYGAAKLGLKHDGLFFFAGWLSQAIHAPFGLEDSAIIARRSKESIQAIRDIFGATRSSYWEGNDVFKLLQKVDPTSAPFIYLAVGSQDGIPEILELTYKFTYTLRKQSIVSELHETAGAHNWQLWNKEIEIVQQRINQLMLKV